jgi:hypothetical protein
MVQPKSSAQPSVFSKYVYNTDAFDIAPVNRDRPVDVARWRARGVAWRWLRGRDRDYGLVRPNLITGLDRDRDWDLNGRLRSEVLQPIDDDGHPLSRQPRRIRDGTR